MKGRFAFPIFAIMQVAFSKYQGTGNDFVLIDNRQHIFSKNNTKIIARMCDRRFGIGADGLILLENHDSLDFKMVYFNADGKESSMCGNGGRCIVKFANALGIIEDSAQFEAIDGLHEATIHGESVRLKMSDVAQVDITTTHAFLNTGSPHHVTMESNVEQVNVKEQGAEIRYGTYGSEGANINFVQKTGDAIFSVRTYERGVEDETLSCGTGVTAVAIAMYEMKQTSEKEVILDTPGGKLIVRFDKEDDRFTNIYLEGPANFVFKGVWQ